MKNQWKVVKGIINHLSAYTMALTHTHTHTHTSCANIRQLNSVNLTTITGTVGDLQQKEEEKNGTVYV